MGRFIRFCIVGGGGFVVDSIVYLLVSAFLSPLVSRLASFSSAVFFTYVLNRVFTFKSQGVMSVTEFARYYANMVIGGIVNITTFCVAIKASETIYSHPVIGIALGSIAGLFVNFMTSRILFCKP